MQMADIAGILSNIEDMKAKDILEITNDLIFGKVNAAFLNLSRQNSI